ncbi:cupin-like domain-containing protein [Paraglaciecola sp.]|uniref:cupin-like domain-containing protein n=1 Tax=Paraglaciecola sp. TaxID=1920173 RepID=UPI0030F43D5C
MLAIEKKVEVVTGCQPDNIPAQVLTSKKPLILKGLVADWPVTQAGLTSAKMASDYLAQFYQNRPVTVAYGEPDIQGRVFYNDDFSGFNYQSQQLDLNTVFEQIHQHSGDIKPPTIYVASTLVDRWLPGLRNENDLSLANEQPLVSIWLGNRSRIPAHYDLPDNIACSVVGRRRFTLFPPEQLANLYPGPIDWAPGGQSISLVDFAQPDLAKYPKFQQALAFAQVAELEPGDALFIPSMWWHHVESLEAFNVLINYWWRQSPAYMSTPENALHHALLTLRDLPEEQKRAWQGIFEHYVFNADNDTSAHIPEHCRGFLAPIDDHLARKLRALLLNKLNR